jgi:hypothetical protein
MLQLYRNEHTKVKLLTNKVDVLETLLNSFFDEDDPDHLETLHQIKQISTTTYDGFIIFI